MIHTLAEAAANDITPWVQSGGTIGAFAMVCWVLRHLLITTIPKISDTFSAEIKSQRDAYEKDFNVQRETNSRELREARTDYRDEIKHITDRYEKQLNADRNVLQSILTMHQASHAAVVTSHIPEQPKP